MTARLKYQHGVTLVELILSMVIISVALVGILSVINLTVSHSADPVANQQAIAIAESYLEEILLQKYSGDGTTSTRANFDEVSDYDGLIDNPIKDQQGIEVAGLSHYSVTVSVSGVTLADSISAKQITVSVSGPGVSNLNLVGYKADY